jgi:HMG (high mobility group) box
MSYKPLSERRSDLFASPPLFSPEETISADWEAEYDEEMDVVRNSISQNPPLPKNIQFIDDIKIMLHLNSYHEKTKCIKEKPKNRKDVLHKFHKVATSSPRKKSRARNAFILYRKVMQAKAEHKGKTQVELSRFIGNCWRNERPEMKTLFERAAELEQGTLFC